MTTKGSEGSEAERFYRDLQQREISGRIAMEATGYSRWFERLLAELGFELWIGNPAEIKAKRLRLQRRRTMHRSTDDHILEKSS